MPAIPSSFTEFVSGRYRIEHELGHGAMATVYLAEDLKHRRKVAIKLFTPEAAAEITTERFLREIEIAARLNHPHILPLHDSGAAGAGLYYAMPYIEGGSLRERLDREKQLPLDDALRLVQEIASALEHAHRQGLVHRDVKPENVLLSDGIALVADFGIARALGTSDRRITTQTGLVLGTPLYMSPEQAIGSPELDARADLYSLGCVMYEMLVGEPPFPGTNALSVLARHAHGDVPPFGALRLGIPEAIESVVRKLLAKAPAERYESAAQFAEDLSVATTGAPTPHRATSAIPHNLPSERTSFVGRDQELAECSRLLGDTRLLTLTGAGGCGKTRLSLRLAARVLETYPDGVWFVDLAPLSEGSRVPQAVAVTLEVRAEPGRDLTEALRRHVVHRRMLLVLDNCEHVLETTGSLVDVLLDAAPDLKVLGTSREALGLAGERQFTVPTLSLPPSHAPHDLHTIEASEAVRLFVARANAVQPEFELGDANARIVAEICRRLDGIPLAIELAATRVKMLSVEQIQSKLDHRFQLLIGGNRGLPRHQTLRAALGWSYDHLAADEQKLFRVLSVFTGGWTLEAAAAVAGAEIDEFEVLRLLTQLVGKSLVVVERLALGEVRYRMLETVQHYAQEMLDDSGEADEARGMHLEYFIAWAEEREPMIASAQAECLRHVDREHDNVLAALDWCGRVDARGEHGMRIVGALWRYWFYRGLAAQGRTCLAEALGRAPAESPTLIRARALLGAGRLALGQGDLAGAQSHYEESLAIFRALQNPAGIARALSDLAILFTDQNDREAARANWEESLALARELEDQYFVLTLLNNLGELARQGGDMSEARRLHMEALAGARAHGVSPLLPICLVNLALEETHYRELEAARQRLIESLPLVLELGTKVLAPVVLDAVAVLADGLGDRVRAARFYAAAGTMWSTIGSKRDLVDEQTRAPILARARQELDEDAFARATAAGGALTHEAAMNDAMAWLTGAQERGEQSHDRRDP